MAGQQPSLGDKIKESIAMLKYLDTNLGPSPIAVLCTCYKQFGSILLNEKTMVNKWFQKHYLNLNTTFRCYSTDLEYVTSTIM